MAVIGDVTRFPRPGRLVSYLGLDPRVRQSGARSFTGHISRAGQAHARSLLIEAAHAAVRTPGPLRAFHDRIRRRRGSGVAIVAVARKLAVLAWHLLTKDTDYRWSPATLSADKVRRLELLAGAPKRFELRGTFRGARAERSTARALERAALETAEQAYRELVRSRTRSGPRPAADAAAAPGSD